MNKELQNNETKTKYLNDFLIDTRIDILGRKIRLLVKNVKKEYSAILSSRITLINNERKDIIKVIKSLENRGILLKGTTRKITSQEGGLLNFLRPSMTTALPLMKNILTPLTKSVLVPLGLTAAVSETDATIKKKQKNKRKIDEKIKLHSGCIDYGFKKFEKTILMMKFY